MKKKFKYVTYKFGYITCNDPFKAIESAFELCGVDTYKNFVSDVLINCTQKETCFNNCIPHVLEMRDCIKDFIFLSYHISACKYRTTSYRVTDSFFIEAFIASREDALTCWNDRTQILDEASCEDPYLAFDDIFSKWQPQELFEEFEFAMHCATESYEGDEFFDFNILEVYFSISSLIEACYLIYAFEIYPLNNLLSLKPSPQY